MLARFNRFLTASNESNVDSALTKQLNHNVGLGIFSSRIMYNDMLAKSIVKKYSSSDNLRRVIENISPVALQNIQTKWHPVHASMYAWIKNMLPNYILGALGDRAEVVHSIEGRPPFLDHLLAELLGNITPSLKTQYESDVTGPESDRSPFWSQETDAAAAKFWEKWTLREATKPFVTELYVHRKHPFSAPATFSAGGPMHQLFKRLLAKENVDALGFPDWPTIQQYYEVAFSEAGDPAALRKCNTVASLVTLSQRFGVATAQV